MRHILIFGGTVEGRKLLQWCVQAGLSAAVSVATEYGEELLEAAAGKGDKEPPVILCGRMDAEQIQEYLHMHPVELVVDATHPHAAEATRNIRQACEAEATEYLRLLREGAGAAGAEQTIISVESASEAAQFLQNTVGNIMLTTGSKELPVFCEYLERSRLYPRVLPSPDSIRICEECSVPPANRIAMQGPFSEEMNRLLLRQFNCRYLVTKESGPAGGYEEKCSACAALGVTAVVIRRPSVEKGLGFAEVCGYLRKKFRIAEEAARITIAGIGMGSESSMTVEVREAIARADMLIGGGRMLKPYENSGKLLVDSYQAEEIRQEIDAHPECRSIVVLMSGDVGFYSGARKLREVLSGRKVEVLPGISSVVCLAAKTGFSWQDMELCSLHGRKQNLLARIRHHETVFALTGKGSEIPALCTQLLENGLGGVELFVGENLSYPEERIWHGSPAGALNETFAPLCALIVWNRNYEKPLVCAGIPDAAFVRGKVPMTKEEIRTISISKLQLHRDSVIYDVGAGTGSVSIEAALAAEDGMVYAIEKKEEAAALIRENQRKFGAGNLQVVCGTAPEALADLPAPTHAFIGGSSGNLHAIITCLMEKNPRIRIVINAVTLETMAEIVKLAEQYETEIVMVTAARANPVGSYHLMMGQNPVMIAVVQGRENRDGAGEQAGGVPCQEQE